MKDKLFSTKNLVRMALFAALATVVMLFKFPLPFAPSFYKLDFSEAVVLIAAFVLGPVAGVIVELVKVLLNLLMDGTTTMYVGEISNFLMGASLVLPAAVIYRQKKDFRGALLGVIVGGVCMVIVSALLNYFVLLPAYSTAFGMELEKIIGMGTAHQPLHQFPVHLCAVGHRAHESGQGCVRRCAHPAAYQIHRKAAESLIDKFSFFARGDIFLRKKTSPLALSPRKTIFWFFRGFFYFFPQESFLGKVWEWVLFSKRAPSRIKISFVSSLL